MSYKLFPETVSTEEIRVLAECARLCRGGILSMTTLAGTGHPGGSMSSIDLLLTVYKFARLSPAEFDEGKSDNMVVSIGHISPGVYTCLASNGYFSMDDAVSQFRLAGSIYEGHIERTVRGVELTTGNLGQGLSAACGMAYADKVKGVSRNTFVLMGDGEQQKGQQAEARHFAVKYKLDNLIAFIDLNGLQISGKTSSVMPVNIAAEYKASGWEVFEVDGHDYGAVASVIRKAQQAGVPSLVLARTVMGKGVSFMENQAKYHGSVLSVQDYEKAMSELGLTPALAGYKELRNAFVPDLSKHILPERKTVFPKAENKVYGADISTDCRSAYGSAVERLAQAAAVSDNPVVVFDCDLASSVKTNGAEKVFPQGFAQCGISEHHAASAAGGASLKGVIPFYSTFTMFAVDEVYNQLRMNDINGTNLKVVCTHAGIDVGEDGKTHQCIDYLGLLRNLFGFKVICPADPNQTDKAVIYAASFYGNVCIVMGRSKVPVITKDDGTPFFGEDFKFEYGKLDEIRTGEYPLLSYGVMLHRALDVKDVLEKDGLSLGVYNAATPSSVNKDDVLKLAGKGIIFVMEDHNPQSGLYSTICNIVASAGIACKVIPFGANGYAYSGNPDSVFSLMGMDALSVAAKIKEVVKC